MTSISIAALKEMTIGEICKLVKQAERLPDNNSPRVPHHQGARQGSIDDLPVKEYSHEDTKTQTAQQLLNEINKKQQEEKTKWEQ